MKIYKSVIKSNKEKKKILFNNERKSPIINIDLLKKEENLITEKKLEFEKNLFEEIKIFDNIYETKYLYFIHKFNDIVKITTKNEFESMSYYSKLFN